MSLDVVHGESRNRQATAMVAAELGKLQLSGTLYLGYPVLATADDRVDVDALLISHEHGLVAFQIADVAPADGPSWSAVIDDQDRLFTVLGAQLRRHDFLRRGRQLATDPRTITVLPNVTTAPPAAEDGVYVGLEQLPEALAAFDGVDEDLFRKLQAAMQRVSNIRPAKKRTSVVTDGSLGSKLKVIEPGIANLDRWQSRAAIETPEGPQRIRGLAGSGKTVVLSLKAAYLHANKPDWNIALTFSSRALYQQLTDLVLRFSFEHSNDKPDFDKLRIMHAWGGSGRDGVYRAMARHVGFPVRDFGAARALWGYDNAFKGACAELLASLDAVSFEPLFDAILIDEAQDLPTEFFQLVYRFTAEPKRIVWGYDELQKLEETAMPETIELFGTADDGAARVDLDSEPGQARRDIILPVCYRNTPWALATAHALGFGIYRHGGLVQHFDDATLWRDIGYDIADGELNDGSSVDLYRGEKNSPEYFYELLNPEDAVVAQSFADELSQDVWIAQQIRHNLDVDELDHDDILIVLPNAYTSKSRAQRLTRALTAQGINSHLVGVTVSSDAVFMPDSIAMTHIHRAKGNEAPMVYVVDAHRAASAPETVSKRNTLFTAITRSRAWVRISGHGEFMPAIAKEIGAVRAAGYHLRFTIPDEGQRATMRRLHKDRSQRQIARTERAEKTLEQVLSDIDNEQVDREDLSPALRRRLLETLGVDPDTNPE